MKIDATTIIEYTHEEFEKSIESLVTQVSNSDFQADYVVGIVRGGAIPAVYLSHKLKIPVQMVHWSLRDENGNESNTWIPEDINAGKKVIVIDDIIDGGDTITSLLEDWQSSIFEPLKMENVRIAALWYNPSQPVKVDFYDHVIDRNEDTRWVVFPWEC